MSRNDRPRVTVVGSFGHGNLGDDVLLYRLRELVLAAAPGARLQALALGRTRYPTGTLSPVAISSKHPVRSVSALASCLGLGHAVIVGPGGLINGHYPRILESLTLLVMAAHARGQRTGLIGVGVGPFGERRDWRGWLRRLGAACDVITVRDEASREVWPEEVRCKIEVGADVAWGLESAARTGLQRRGLILSVRPWPHWPTEDILRRAEAVADAFAEVHPGEPVDLIPMDKDDDAPLLNTLQQRLGPRMEVRRPQVPDIAGALPFFEEHRAVFAMRYHAALLGALAGCELSLAAYDTKVRSLTGQLRLPFWEPGADVGLELTAPDTEAVDEVRRQAEVHGDGVRALLGRGG